MSTLLAILILLSAWIFFIGPNLATSGKSYWGRVWESVQIAGSIILLLLGAALVGWALITLGISV